MKMEAYSQNEWYDLHFLKITLLLLKYFWTQITDSEVESSFII